MNPFESGSRKVIPAVLVYLRNQKQQILMLHKQGDYHHGKWNGLGGKCEPGESPLEAARREVAEEAGLELSESAFRVLGTLQFPNFKAHKNEDWVVWVLVARHGPGEEPWARGPEGDLVWTACDKLWELNLWEGDRQFLPFVLEERPFVGTIWYDGPKVTRHWIQSLC